MVVEETRTNGTTAGEVPATEGGAVFYPFAADTISLPHYAFRRVMRLSCPYRKERWISLLEFPARPTSPIPIPLPPLALVLLLVLLLLQPLLRRVGPDHPGENPAIIRRYGPIYSFSKYEQMMNAYIPLSHVSIFSSVQTSWSLRRAHCASCWRPACLPSHPPLFQT